LGSFEGFKVFIFNNFVYKFKVLYNSTLLHKNIQVLCEPGSYTSEHKHRSDEKFTMTIKTRGARIFDTAVRARDGNIRNRRSISGLGKCFFFPPKRSERLWGPSSLLYEGYHAGRNLSPRAMLSKCQAVHLSPHRAEVKDEWRLPLLPWLLS
jgi:hypothetical protein